MSQEHFFLFSFKKVVVQSQSHCSQTQRQSCSIFSLFILHDFGWCHIVNMYTIVSLSDFFFFHPRTGKKTLHSEHFDTKKQQEKIERVTNTVAGGHNALRHDDLWWRQQHFVVFIYHSPVSRRCLVRRRQNGNVLVAWENITAAYVFVSPFARHTLLAFPPPLFSASLASAFFLVCFVNSPKRKQSGRTRCFLYSSPCRRVGVVCVLLPDTLSVRLISSRAIFSFILFMWYFYNIREHSFLEK